MQPWESDFWKLSELDCKFWTTSVFTFSCSQRIFSWLYELSFGIQLQIFKVQTEPERNRCSCNHHGPLNDHVMLGGFASKSLMTWNGTIRGWVLTYFYFSAVVLRSWETRVLWLFDQSWARFLKNGWVFKPSVVNQVITESSQLFMQLKWLRKLVQQVPR